MATITGAPPSHAQDPPSPVAYQMVLQEVYVPMDDDTRIAMTIGFPSSDGQTPAAGPFPALLTLTPYGKDITGPSSYFVMRGYIHGVADIRGAGASEGNLNDNYFSPREQRDGAALVQYLGTQVSQSSCFIGMIGGSYLGITQYMTAEQQPACLKAIVPSVAASDLYREAAYHGGILSQFFGAQYLALQQNGLGFLSGPQEANNRTDAINAKLGQAQSNSIAFDYLANTTDTEFYRDRSPITNVDKITVPVLIYDGWFDGFIRGATEMFPRLARRQGVETCLWMDPVPHKGAGSLTAVPPYNPMGYPASALDDFRAGTLDFLDRHLKGHVRPACSKAKLYLMGRDTYIEPGDYPPPGTSFEKFYLGVPGLAGAGTIAQAPPADGEQSYPTNPVDGWTNTLARHGNMAVSPYLPLDQSLEKEEGLTWETGPLSQPLRLIGPLALHLVAKSTAPDTDWFVRVSDVQPNASAKLLTEGFLRASHRALDLTESRAERPYHTHLAPTPIQPGEYLDYEIEIWPTGNEFEPGHGMRVQLTSVDTPNHTPGTFTIDKDDPSRIELRPNQPALNTVKYGAAGSYLTLPVAP